MSQKVVAQLGQPLAGALDFPQPALPVRRFLGQRGGQISGRSGDDGQRGAQLMGDHPQKLALTRAGLLLLRQRLFQHLPIALLAIFQPDAINGNTGDQQHEHNQ